MEKQIVEEMINFLRDRGGFDDWWGNVDEETQNEMIEQLEEIVKNKL